MAHYAHYVKRAPVGPLAVTGAEREKAVQTGRGSETFRPWYGLQQADDQGFERPAFHVTKSTFGPAARITVGDTIWLFAQLRTVWHEKFPPALDAKIVVVEVHDLREKREPDEPAFCYRAGPGSEWFPLFDARSALRALATVDARGVPQCLLSRSNQPVGQALRAIRQLADVAPLLDLERTIRRRGFDFVSYRLIDGTRMAAARSLAIVQDGCALWWDRWSLPRRLVERREGLQDAALDAQIRRRIKDPQCNRVWVVRSSRYAEEGSYSRQEMELASSTGKLHDQDLATVEANKR